MRFALCSILIASMLGASALVKAEQVLYQYRTWSINDSKYGPIRLFQTRLKQALADCESRQTLKPDGAFGPGTKKSIIAVTKCPQIDTALREDSPARHGAISDTLWHLIVPNEDVPNVTKRAAALKLTFEATDYDKMQWNFCQNKPFYDPSNGQDVCYSNDKAAFITWGPHGATAGHGKEVQGILNLFLNSGDSERAETFKRAFGDESNAVMRMLNMPKTSSDNNKPPLETYLCSIWTNKNRREAWRSGFKKLGAIDEVQALYRSLYSAKNFDGGKILSFYQAWQDPRFNLPVTEIDHGFFVDRSAHMGISKNALLNALAELKESYQGEWPPLPAEVRQHISNKVIPSNRKQDRMGRDVAYYVHNIPASQLSEKERTAWIKRGSRNAVDVGLSDSRFMPNYRPTSAIEFENPNGELAADETCPVAVLNPKSPN